MIRRNYIKVLAINYQTSEVTCGHDGYSGTVNISFPPEMITWLWLGQPVPLNFLPDGWYTKWLPAFLEYADKNLYVYYGQL